MTTDQAQRDRALDPRTSFLVQAPAGSGKTELLIQRYLTLLARVEQPQSVVAITFTKKAAGEMRGRVLDALRSAANSPEPVEPHKQTTWRRALDVLDHDQRLGWHLLEHPSRLAIQTVDSLCLWLTRRMPLTSGFGSAPGILEDASELYREAARETLALLESDGPHSSALEAVLRHIDNNLVLAEDLLTEMLPQRDQWLRHLSGAGSVDPMAIRTMLETTLRDTIVASLERVRAIFPSGCDSALMRLSAFACARSGSFEALAGCGGLPACTAEGLAGWQDIANLFLTGEGSWRRRWDVRSGFPRGSRQKSEIAELCERIQCEPLRLCLAELRTLPAPNYTEAQWNAIYSLVRLLPVAAAQLKLVFRSRRQIDFGELSRAAIDALGSAENPSELAYSLDCRIEHLLVDEFQDTSHTQWTLLERLTADWQPGDGRTLFCVGDPMQSIFRFREAEVALFLRARESGLGPIRFEPLTLSTNFRSGSGIVDWVNNAFRQVLPEQENAAMGAVIYAPSTPAFPLAADAQAVRIHPLIGKNDAEEAALVQRLIEDARDLDPEGSTAILVRTRPAAWRIAQHLREAGIRFQAVEMTSLAESPAIQDLFSLTRALLHLGDRIAWLSVLRAPWCGLSLADLTALAGEGRETVWDLLRDPNRLAAMSAPGRLRAERAARILKYAVDNRARLPLRTWIEETWLGMGGPACLAGEQELADVEAFFDLIESCETGGDLTDFEALARRMEDLYARPDPAAGSSLQLLTMHKAKGLEFDTVILPGLGRSRRNDDQKLLSWADLPAGLLLAPVRERGVPDDPLSAYVRYVESAKTNFEESRLLYVAATRARRRLHIIGHAEVGTSGQLREPRSGTLLARLWPVVARDFTDSLEREAANEGANAATAAPSLMLRRLSDAYTDSSVLVEPKLQRPIRCHGDRLHLVWRRIAPHWHSRSRNSRPDRP